MSKATFFTLYHLHAVAQIQSVDTDISDTLAYETNKGALLSNIELAVHSLGNVQVR